jgi:hypothetical protein
MRRNGGGASVWTPLMCVLSAALLAATPASGQDSGQGIVALSIADLSEFETDDRLGFPAVPLDELGRLGLTDLQTTAGMISAMYRGSRLELYLGAPFLRYGRVVYQLPNSPYEAGGGTGFRLPWSAAGSGKPGARSDRLRRSRPQRHPRECENRRPRRRWPRRHRLRPGR